MIKYFEIYDYMNADERQTVVDLLVEVVARAGFDLDTFDFELRGSIIDETSETSQQFV